VEAKNTSLDRDILAISRTTVSQFSQPAIDDKWRARADDDADVRHERDVAIENRVGVRGPTLRTPLETQDNGPRCGR
jgi:hypothetical protein